MNKHTDIDSTVPALDPQVCRAARLSRDPRFDGEFFLAVRSTGIYCRPVCPARAPAERNVSYYRAAAQAARDGYRPCLRCRPESAPESPAWLGSSTTVRRALGLIEQGALQEGSVADLADRLGVGERYLRKLFQRELGVSPSAIALNQRLLFAKKLLAETTLPMSSVAFAAGFGSLRRFNSAIREQFRLTPGELRRHHRPDADSGVPVLLQYRPPYDWEGVIAFFSRHAIAGVESVDADSYRRNIILRGQPGSFTVRHRPKLRGLEVELVLPDLSQLMPVVARVRRMFDLDANPANIGESLGQDATLAQLLERFPGIRSPICWSLFESSVRAIVGQQVSVAAARGVLSRLARAASPEDPNLAFPTAAALGKLGDDNFPMPGRRRETLQQLCRDFAHREAELELDTLAGYRGVGPWTVAMVAMRGLGNPDIFPARDLGLERAWQNFASPGDKLDDRHTENWRPWRAYAANLLWRSLGI